MTMKNMRRKGGGGGRGRGQGLAMWGWGIRQRQTGGEGPQGLWISGYSLPGRDVTREAKDERRRWEWGRKQERETGNWERGIGSGG
ncbi:hypothetical protein DENSPDRAFT_131273 [Dentipellis sp. KUC8613]|nr:hypothetical protein DENSPDRAFT_131273 [Dentipellis sp. KUC8613]